MPHRLTAVIIGSPGHRRRVQLAEDGGHQLHCHSREHLSGQLNPSPSTYHLKSFTAGHRRHAQPRLHRHRNIQTLSSPTISDPDDSGDRGVILNIASMCVQFVVPDHSNSTRRAGLAPQVATPTYSGTKFGVVGFSRSLAVCYALYHGGRIYVTG